jgi:hypothetical protein
MHSADYQRFAAALCDADAALPAFIRAPAAASLADRFAVYRNNVHVSLVDSLAHSFPIAHAHVGDEFFRAMAREYVQDHKPQSPLLTFYGKDFPDFIAAFEPAHALPWLPDLARLEQAWSDCWAAADMPALPITTLRSLGAEELAQSRLIAHPAARLVRSAWPVADLWQAHQCAQPDLTTLEWRPQNVLLTRPHAQVLLHPMDDTAATFTAALLEGATIETAAASAQGFDAGALLRQLFDDGSIVEIRS